MWSQYDIISENGIGETPAIPKVLEFRKFINATHAKMFSGNILSVCFNAPLLIKYFSSLGVYLKEYKSASISFFPIPRLLYL